MDGPSLIETEIEMRRAIGGRALYAPNAIRKLTQMLGRSDIISLPQARPSAETFPPKNCQIAARVIRERGRFVLQYGPTRGQGEAYEDVIATLDGRGSRAHSPLRL